MISQQAKDPSRRYIERTCGERAIGSIDLSFSLYILMSLSAQSTENTFDTKLYDSKGLDPLDSGVKNQKSIERAANTDDIFKIIAKAVEDLDFQLSLSEFLNSLAQYLQCERVSFGFFRNRKPALKGMSNCSEVKKRTAAVHLLESVISECCDNDQITLSQAKKNELDSPSILHEHNRLKLHSGARSICSIPLKIDNGLSSVLIIETTAQTFSSQQLLVAESAFRLVNQSLVLKFQQELSITQKNVEFIKQFLQKLLGPSHWKAKLTSLTLVSIFAFLVFAQGEYKITAKTHIEGVVQRAAVAPFDGYVKEAPIRAGDLVKAGNLLCLIDDRDLVLERFKWISEVQQIKRQHQKALSIRDGAKIKIIEAQMEQAENELKAINSKLQRTKILAPFDGIVVSGDLSQAIGAPIQQGDVLFEVAPLDDYRIILKVDESEIARIEKGQVGQLKLSSFATKSIPFSITQITPVSSSEEGRTYFQVEARLKSKTELNLRPGMGGIGKISIENRRLIWIWTHRAIEAIKLKLWGWLP